MRLSSLALLAVGAVALLTGAVDARTHSHAHRSAPIVAAVAPVLQDACGGSDYGTAGTHTQRMMGAARGVVHGERRRGEMEAHCVPRCNACLTRARLPRPVRLLRLRPVVARRLLRAAQGLVSARHGDSRGSGRVALLLTFLSLPPLCCRPGCSQPTSWQRTNLTLHGMWPNYKQSQSGHEWPQCCQSTFGTDIDVTVAKSLLSAWQTYWSAKTSEQA